MSKLLLSGRKFDQWTVIKDSGQRNKSGTVIWLCRCSCGKLSMIPTGNLVTGKSRSCGCFYGSKYWLEWRKKQVKLGKKYFDLNWLKEKGGKLDIYEIAKICSTNPERIRTHALRHDIKIKEKEWTDERRKLISNLHKGSKNVRWNSGASEYQNHYELKRNRIKAFELKDYKCEYCEKPAKITHHIDGDKTNHSIENLLVLCYKCHGKLHGGGIRESKYRRLYGMSLQEMSIKTSLSMPTICNYFNNKFKPHLKTEFKIRELEEELGIKQ